MSAVNIQLRRKGILTLPVRLRRKYGLDENAVFTLEDLGDGSFLLIPQVSRVAVLGDRVAELMTEENVDLKEVLQTLEDEREQYYQQNYVQS